MCQCLMLGVSFDTSTAIEKDSTFTIVQNNNGVVVTGLAVLINQD